MSASDEQVGGTHYKNMPVQPWDAMRAWMSNEAFRGFLLGNVIKYAARHESKGGVEDLRKARHYLDKLIETYEAPAASFADALDGAVQASLKDKYATSEEQATDWPGPDWSQAPKWATHYIEFPEYGIWLECQPKIYEGGIGPGVTYGPGRQLRCKTYGYPGHWRDSLRRRPE